MTSIREGMKRYLIHFLIEIIRIVIVFQIVETHSNRDEDLVELEESYVKPQLFSHLVLCRIIYEPYNA